MFLCAELITNYAVIILFIKVWLFARRMKKPFIFVYTMEEQETKYQATNEQASLSKWDQIAIEFVQREEGLQ